MALGSVSRTPVDIILFFYFPPSIAIVVNDGVPQLHTGGFETERCLRTSFYMRGLERPTMFCRETAAYIGSGKEIKENNAEAFQKIEENRIVYLIN